MACCAITKLGYIRKHLTTSTTYRTFSGLTYTLMLWKKSLLPSHLLLLLLFLFLLLLHLCPAQRGKNLGSCNFWISKYIWEVVSLFWILIYNMCIFVMVVTYYKWQHEWSASVGELHAKKICHFKSIGQLLLQFPGKILMQIYWNVFYLGIL